MNHPLEWEREGPEGAVGQRRARQSARRRRPQKPDGWNGFPLLSQGVASTAGFERYVVRVAPGPSGARAVLGQVAKRRLFAVLEGQGFVRVGESVVERRGCGRRARGVGRTCVHVPVARPESGGGG